MQHLFRKNSSQIKFGICAAASGLAFAFGTAYSALCKSNKNLNDDTTIENFRIIPPRDNRQLGEAISLKKAIRLSQDLVKRVKDETGAPGIVIGVSVDGKNVWQEGIGLSDVENRVPCTYQTVMRIASISKSLTAIAAAKLWENEQLDLDKPIKEYLPDYPDKFFNDEKVDITCRQLLSHLSGIRHYNKALPGTKTENSKEFLLKEFSIKDKFNTVSDALVLFKDDPLHYKPGTKYLYTTHGFTLLSAVIEKLSKESFPVHMTKLFKLLGMKNTFPDVNDAFIYNRSHYYSKNEKGKIMNAPFVDNSYKWAGGGFVSTVGDLLKFANAMLYSAQTPEMTNENSTTETLPGFLKQKTIKMLWKIAVEPQMIGTGDGGYGMGWAVTTEEQKYGNCRYQPQYFYHTGGAIGASSVVLILPSRGSLDEKPLPNKPSGVAVAILINLQDVKLAQTALEIAQIFQNVKPHRKK